MSDEAQDAARYRWLTQWVRCRSLSMDGSATWALALPITALPRAPSFDAAVDIAMACQPKGATPREGGAV